MKKSSVQNSHFFLLLFFVFFCAVSHADPVKLQELETRVQALETYAETIQPTLVEMTNGFNNTLNSYSQMLEQQFDRYNTDFDASLDQKLKIFDKRVVLLNAYDKAYQRIETNSGTFLIAVNSVVFNGGKHRLNIVVGNPNYADYKGLKLKVWYGSKWDQQGSYEQWRSGLSGMEFSFDQKLEKSSWTALPVDLEGSIDYIECEMDITSVELYMDQRS